MIFCSYPVLELFDFLQTKLRCWRFCTKPESSNQRKSHLNLSAMRREDLRCTLVSLPSFSEPLHSNNHWNIPIITETINSADSEPSNKTELTSSSSRRHFSTKTRWFFRDCLKIYKRTQNNRKPMVAWINVRQWTSLKKNRKVKKEEFFYFLWKWTENDLENDANDTKWQMRH